ncbi:MAG TPA: hypothetical protein VGL76_02970 [Gaiellaceae bacterium]|jgi:hypothetical protein
MSGTLVLRPWRRGFSVDPLIEEAWEHQRRRRRHLLLAVLGAAVAAGVFGVVYSASAPPKVQLVETNLAAALGRSNDLILYTRVQTTRYSGNNVETRLPATRSWKDLETGEWRSVSPGGPAGSLTYGNSFTKNPNSTLYTQHEITVWYRSHSFVSQTVKSQPLPTPKLLCGCDPTNARGRNGQTPHVVSLPTQRLNGQPASHLQVSWSGTKRIIDIWINRTTDLPVRLVESSNGRVGRVTDYKWLPRTKANLARTTFTIPVGFKQVS